MSRFERFALLSVLPFMIVFPNEAESQSDWSIINFVNEYGEVADRGVSSSRVRPLRSLELAASRARIFYACGGNNTGIELEGVHMMSITEGELSSDWTELEYPLRFRVDGSQFTINATYNGNDELTIKGTTSRNRLISAIKTGTVISVSIPFYSGRAAYRWSLRGSAAAIQRACR